MSQSSTHSGNIQRRLPTQQNTGRRSRNASLRRKKSISYNDAYLYALRVAYLAYLLHPRAKRSRRLPAKPAVHRSTTSSFNDLMNDFSLVRDSKSTRLPRDFISELEKRLRGILIGTERRQEYQDAVVKTSFAVFLNSLTEPSFKKQMEKERRAEDLVLIFFSNTTKQLGRGKAPGDDSVKLMTDRHVALFVRLMSLILKDHGWAADRPELTSRLATLESKLLKHDEDLASVETDSTGTFVEEFVPLSHEVKDMPMVQTVARIFGLTNTMAQSDITKHKAVWNEKAALQDLKTYQTQLNLNTKRTLNSEDFDTTEAYELWKKAEAPDLSQMMLAIVQANPELAQGTPGGALPQFRPHANGSSPTSPSDAHYSEISKILSQSSEPSSYFVDLPADMSGLNFDESSSTAEEENTLYTFIPPDPRGMFRFILSAALSHDLQDASLQSNPDPSNRLLSKESTELLNEIALRWRIPKFTRVVLFLDVIREKFIEQSINLELLDAAFNYVKEPFSEDGKRKNHSIVMITTLYDRNAWTVSDFVLMQTLINGIYGALQRDLYGAMMQCYNQKPSALLGQILAVLDEHIRSDPSFSENPDSFHRFSEQVTEGLANRAREVYSELVDKEIPQKQETWEFYHIVQLCKAVLKLAERVQKRYRKNPEILGVNPLIILLENILPSFADDSQAMIVGIIEAARIKGDDIPIQDGLDLYNELREFRRVFADALPSVPFPYSIEDLLAEFVWRWISVTETQICSWVENAIKQDRFQVRTEEPNRVPTEDERYSVSVMDVFRSFSQVVDHISNLGWDDDLGYAKFMTALSKSLGNGISRYCEILEQMFSKEMDRLSPEQEAAATLSKQEKWMQLAKETLSTKEKLQPFHFYPESFVKLNDISYAIRNWDKLEHDINVDACADVIQKHSLPATQRQRKVSNYVFTIKLVEGEDLKAMDVSGYSDPYVVLTDEYQKRLYKTRIVYQNLNPRWDESVDITTQGPLNIIATIWDWDAIGDHDYIGRTSLKLDPAHFGDFVPQEHWLDLDTQGRLLVRVSMEGERDDIQFYFGKAFRILKRTERDMTRKITDKLSAYINHCLSRRVLRSLTSRGIMMSSVSSIFNRSRLSALPTANMPSDAEVINALKPLFTYFDDNFAIMNQTLTSEAMIAVMTRLWKEVLVTIEALIVPPLSDKPSQQKPLNQQELDIVFKWLRNLFDFFHAVDEETGEVNGVPTNVLKNPKYHEIQSLNFFYFETTDNLIRTSERMASANAASQQAARSRVSAPAMLGASLGSGFLTPGTVSTRRAKSIMLSRNLGTMRRAKEEKWKAAQAEPSDDMILRILRMRPEAGGYLRDRSRQKERLAVVAAAEVIVRQSLLAGGGGRMTMAGPNTGGFAGRR